MRAFVHMHVEAWGSCRSSSVTLPYALRQSLSGDSRACQCGEPATHLAPWLELKTGHRAHPTFKWVLGTFMGTTVPPKC